MSEKKGKKRGNLNTDLAVFRVKLRCAVIPDASQKEYPFVDKQGVIAIKLPNSKYVPRPSR